MNTPSRNSTIQLSLSRSVGVALLFSVLAACEQSDRAPTPTAVLPQPVKNAPSLHVETMVVAVGAGRQGLALAGKIAYGEDRYSKVSSPLQGRVIEVRARLGAPVKAGDILLVIDSPEIARAYAEYVKEDSDLHYATRAYELANDLYETKALALKDLERTENELVKARAEFRRATEQLLSLRIAPEELKKPLDQQRITSRFEMKSSLSGVVVERAVTPGQSVTGNSDHILFTIADLNVLQVVADVYEHDLGLVHEGQSAVVTVEAYPDMTFQAKVTSIGDLVDPVTRTIKVRAQVDNDAHKLKPEMFARLQLDVSDHASVMIIPRDAVLEEDGRQFVYVVDGNRYERRDVKTLNSSPNQVRVLAGLTPGVRIVTRGAVLIKGQPPTETTSSGSPH